MVYVAMYVAMYVAIYVAMYVAINVTMHVTGRCIWPRCAHCMWSHTASGVACAP